MMYFFDFRFENGLVGFQILAGLGCSRWNGLGSWM